jgi:hypothetical protein
MQAKALLRIMRCEGGNRQVHLRPRVAFWGRYTHNPHCTHASSQPKLGKSGLSPKAPVGQSDYHERHKPGLCIHQDGVPYGAFSGRPKIVALVARFCRSRVTRRRVPIGKTGQRQGRRSYRTQNITQGVRVGRLQQMNVVSARQGFRQRGLADDVHFGFGRQDIQLPKTGQSGHHFK